MIIRDNMPQSLTLTVALPDGTVLTSVNLERKGPSNPFKTGAVGYYGPGGKAVQVSIAGRMHSLPVNLIEAETKGVFGGAAKNDRDARIAAKAEYFAATYEVDEDTAHNLATRAIDAADAAKAAKDAAKAK